jgi:hypothetical protein
MPDEQLNRLHGNTITGSGISAVIQSAGWMAVKFWSDKSTRHRRVFQRTDGIMPAKETVR